jgi:hypothetical protein
MWTTQIVDKEGRRHGVDKLCDVCGKSPDRGGDCHVPSNIDFVANALSGIVILTGGKLSARCNLWVPGE